MPEDIRISELSNVSSLGNNDLIEVSQVNAQSETGYDSKKATMLNVGDMVCNGIEYANALYTSNKKIIGAINELTTYIPVWNNTASGAIATFDTSLALPLQDCTIEINAVQESGTPTPSSPKAISGFTGANIKVVGANQFDKTQSTANKRTNNGVITNSTNNSISEYIKVKPNTSYYVMGALPSATGEAIAYYDDSQTYISRNYLSTGNGTITTPATAVYAIISYPTANEDSVGLNYPATDTAYHAYNPNSTTTAISWQDEAGTVYGGLLRIANGYTNLIDNKNYVDLGSLSWNNASGNLSSSSGIASDVKAPSANTQAFNGLCSCYAVAPRTGISDKQISVQTNGNIVISDTAIAGMTGEQVKAYVTGFILVYEVATPTEYTLASIPPITTLQGTNNVFTDTNGDTSVVYACSLKDYIDGQ